MSHVSNGRLLKHDREKRTVKLSAMRISTSMNRSTRTRRIQLMVSMLIIAYIVLWSPYHIYTILGNTFGAFPLREIDLILFAEF